MKFELLHPFLESENEKGVTKSPFSHHCKLVYTVIRSAAIKYGFFSGITSARPA